MYDATINFGAIIVAALSSWLLGYLWYSPYLFGRRWLALVGSDFSFKPASAKKTMLFSLGGAIVMASVLGIVTIGVESVSDGAQIGFWMWLGFVATTTLNEFIYSAKPKPWAIYYINNGYYLASLIIIGAILAGWK